MTVARNRRAAIHQRMRGIQAAHPTNGSGGRTAACTVEWMTGRERILAAFHGGKADIVPFCPNIYYWFYNRLVTGTLPDEIASARHPFDALRVLGAEILARWDTQAATREVWSGGEYSEDFGGSSSHDRPAVTAFNVYPTGRSIRRQRFATPHGVLNQTWVYS